MLTAEVDLLTVLIAAIVHMLIGMAWYSKSVFGKTWMKLSGLKEKDLKKDSMGRAMGMGFVAALIMSYVLASFVDFARSTAVIEGMQVGFWLWLGFVATTMVNGVIWEGKPFKLYAINAGYLLVSMMVMGGILVAWSLELR